MKLAIIGNCQARPLGRLLSAASSMVEIIDVPPVHTIPKSELEHWAEYVAAADCVIHQPLSDVFGALASHRLKEQLGDKTISFPSIYFAGTLPQLIYLRKPTGGSLQGPLGDYHDIRILNGFLRGLTPEACARDLESTVFPAHQHYTTCVSESIEREEKLDIRIMDEILERVQTTQTMFSFNHPDNNILWSVTKKLLQCLELTVDGINKPPEREILSEIVAAVPLQISEVLGLPYRQPEYLRRGEALDPLELVGSFHKVYHACDVMDDILAFNQRKGQPTFIAQLLESRPAPILSSRKVGQRVAPALPEKGNSSVIIRHKDLTDEICVRNRVEIDPSSRIDNLTLQFAGSDAELRIGPACKLTGRIFLSSGAKVTIGARTIIHGAAFHVHEGGEVSLGEQCLLSHGISIRPSDPHKIFDLESGSQINPPAPIRIGAHVWVREQVSIMKGSIIPDGCIVDIGSVVTGQFDTPNCILAGVPARVVRENVRWDY